MKTNIFALVMALTLTACNPSDSNAIKPYKDGEALPHPKINIINLWASWCEPCRQEMPILSNFATQHPEVGVIGIAVDKRDNVAQFLQTQSVPYPIRYHDTDATALFGRFGNNTGGIPYTVIDAPQCNFRKAFFGKITAPKLEETLAQAKQKCQTQ